MRTEASARKCVMIMEVEYRAACFDTVLRPEAVGASELITCHVTDQRSHQAAPN